MKTISVQGFQCRGCYRKMITALTDAGIEIRSESIPRDGIQIVVPPTVTAEDIRGIIPDCLDIDIRIVSSTLERPSACTEEPPADEIR